MKNNPFLKETGKDFKEGLEIPPYLAEIRWRKTMLTLITRLKTAEWIFVPLYFLLFVLSFMGIISGWWIVLLAVITLLLLIYILQSSLRCPQCASALLTWQQLQHSEENRCQTCGFQFDGTPKDHD